MFPIRAWLCFGFSFPTASLRVLPVEHYNVVFPSGVLEEARHVLQDGCGAECLKERPLAAHGIVRSVFVRRSWTRLLHNHRLLEIRVRRWVVRMLRNALDVDLLVLQRGAAIDLGFVLADLAENALRQA